MRNDAESPKKRKNGGGFFVIDSPLSARVPLPCFRWLDSNSSSVEHVGLSR